MPYTGVLYVSIPEFAQNGDFVLQQTAGAVGGSISVDEALKRGQARPEEIMKDAG